MTLYLQMDGVDDFLRTPQITVDRIVMDFSYEPNNPPATTAYYLFDARGGTPSSNYMVYINTGTTLAKGSAITTLKLDGVTVTSATVSPSTRYSVDASFTSLLSEANGIEFFVNYAFQNTTRTKGKLYRITGYNAGSTVFDYNMATGTVQDQSGNGNHGTLTGGTFVDDGVGGGTSYTKTLTDSITLSDSITKKLTGYKTFSDSINLFDSISYQLTSPGQYTTTLLDSITLSDILTIKLGGTIMGVPNIKKMVEGVMPGTTVSTLYTAPANTTGQPSPYATSIIKDIALVNTSNTARTITIGINGVAAANQFIPAQTVPANTTIPITGLNKLLKAGDTIQALQENATAITVHIDGVEVQ